MESFLLMLQILLCGFLCSISSAKDIITATDFLIEDKTIISSDGSFEMGFFSPGSFSNNWYVGIWYKHDVPDKCVVWVANRAVPLNSTSGVMLKIIDTGRLALVTAANTIVWSTNSSRPLAVKNPFSTVYLVHSPPIFSLSGSTKKTKVLVLSLSLLSGVAFISLTIGLYILINTKKKRKLTLKDDLDLPLFALSTITKATSNFSDKNMLGEGGFGSVYKGILEGGQEIAIKRLSKSSSQGVNEFKNEANCIAKLQHRNLVKLIGCCVEGEEKILAYEYMPNRSLDFFIFDENKSSILEWPKRFNIINGIARGLLYLHQDSRLRIIHRDLKASNILLDADMNPKISDFGLARSVIGDETGANTHHVVGTHGYMSPEYLIHGVFSIKSDVFSFGVLVLEIISGRRNRGFFHESHSINLLGHVWKLYKEGRRLELIDVHLTDSCYFTELLRLIHVALLCVQQCPEDRPDMSEVVLMLANDAILPEAKEPGFFTESKFPDSEYSTSMHSINGITVTQLDPR